MQSQSPVLCTNHSLQIHNVTLTFPQQNNTDFAHHSQLCHSGDMTSTYYFVPAGYTND